MELVGIQKSGQDHAQSIGAWPLYSVWPIHLSRQLQRFAQSPMVPLVKTKRFSPFLTCPLSITFVKIARRVSIRSWTTSRSGSSAKNSVSSASITWARLSSIVRNKGKKHHLSIEEEICVVVFADSFLFSNMVLVEIHVRVTCSLTETFDLVHMTCVSPGDTHVHVHGTCMLNLSNVLVMGTGESLPLTGSATLISRQLLQVAKHWWAVVLSVMPVSCDKTLVEVLSAWQDVLSVQKVYRSWWRHRALVPYKDNSTSSFRGVLPNLINNLGNNNKYFNPLTAHLIKWKFGESSPLSFSKIEKRISAHHFANQQ